MNQPLFSILIANYNNGRSFKDCYDSIIAQSYPVSYTHLDVYKRQILFITENL